ncbi:transmembrane protein 221 [Pristis pectinata]|uniref:transmembrane protein 221 n=1 Tax=Pristis pectinata TaxID=685728 RepID=UPI00223E812A|nr:transmembrane protein 221 [Pristis pectinata]XP_051893982.1 transmembrane protein 221 [Pristis pectinata]XP_051893983.1 transmembrane protein 221 [Pristis pectinata]XP_051893985.1 transmembrane protein 221 [Pristis pectinata]
MQRGGGRTPVSPGAVGLSPDRCLAALLSLAALAALMTLPPASLLLQPPGPPLSPVPAGAARLLRLVARGLASLSVSLHLCCLLLALLHGHLAAELRGADGQPDRAGWLLLNSRSSRHLALTAFCLGVIVYSAALCIHVLLEFEKESAITSASILGVGVLAVAIIVIQALVKACRAGRTGIPERAGTLFENSCPPRGRYLEPERLDHMEDKESSRVPAFRKETAYERYREQKAFYVATSASRNGYGRSQAQPAARGLPSTGSWDGVTHEMRRVLARKGTVCRRDSTLV